MPRYLSLVLHHTLVQMHCQVRPKCIMAFQVPKYSAEKKSRVRAENFDQDRVRAKKWVVRVSAQKRWREVQTRAQNIVGGAARGLARKTLGERPGRRGCLSWHRALIAPARPPGGAAVLFLFRHS